MIGLVLGISVFGALFYALLRIVHWIERLTNRWE